MTTTEPQPDDRLSRLIRALSFGPFALSMRACVDPSVWLGLLTARPPRKGR